MVSNPAPRATLRIPLQGITILSVTLVIFLILSIPETSLAAITGPCVNCHTMHNSQGGSAMATYGADGKPWKGTSPLPALTRGTCLGCHGYGGAQKIVTIGGSEIPQVYHTDGSGDLAGGNFAYVLGTKGGGASDAKGHNVKDIGDADATLNAPPGLLPESGHNMIITDTNLTCTGYIGCHGTRSGSFPGIAGIKGAHHQNVDGKCDTADTVANSYRFLLGVKGLENNGTYKWQNYNADHHNEYFGATTPMIVSCANSCHLGPSGAVKPPNNTISGFCATCHGRFHDPTEIGGTSSPFKRHPSDIVLPSDVNKEYKDYTSYSVEAPVGRTTVPDSPSSTVTPGTDVVTCLSCHAAHATNYPDLLKWDYDTMVVGGGGSGGCFTCHTQKDNP